MVKLIPGNQYYCIPLEEKVIFLYWDNGYVVVQNRMEHNYWMKEEDLEELSKE